MAITGFTYKIQWRQFQVRNNRPAGAADEDAEIHTGSKLEYTYQEKDGDFKIKNVNVKITVNSELSWVVRGKQTAALLRHEQGHYDMQALAARESYRRISRVTAISASMLEREKADIENEVQKKLNEKNIRYDTKTDHSRNTTEQRSWENAIEKAKNSPTGSLDQLP